MLIQSPSGKKHCGSCLVTSIASDKLVVSAAGTSSTVERTSRSSTFKIRNIKIAIFNVRTFVGTNNGSENNSIVKNKTEQLIKGCQQNQYFLYPRASSKDPSKLEARLGQVK
ncbi:unnamed protein product [Brachionus calyciflorus]|uniref:Uncharacterized protein n=1 Tax=Brachionus calyciflorus TaxID=104777 RepID=A0A814KRY7_9BILA|nr:unnamed protein product [Brachionus calyciflorus]